jgi:hypothetical protein
LRDEEGPIPSSLPEGFVGYPDGLISSQSTAKPVIALKKQTPSVRIQEQLKGPFDMFDLAVDCEVDREYLSRTLLDFTPMIYRHQYDKSRPL